MKRLLMVLIAVLLAVVVVAQEPTGFEKSSLGWRTALHFDPGAEAPLRSLIQLYQREKKIGELLSLYSQHLAKYPQDEGAKVVLARLYVALADDRVEALLKEALTAHPQNALLLHARALWLENQHDPRSLEALAAAVVAQQDISRREVWLRDLIQKAAQAQREDLVVQRLTVLRSSLTSSQRLGWIRTCLELGLHQAASEVLTGADFSDLQGDALIEAWVVQARVALALKQQAAAATSARSALTLLAPEHWRYREVLDLAWQSEAAAGKAQMLQEAASRWQGQKSQETAAIAYADLLSVADQKEKAGDVLLEALRLQPDSSTIESRVLDHLESQRPATSMIDFLKQRLAQKPDRADLQIRLARALLELGRLEEGIVSLETLLRSQEPVTQSLTLLQTARYLRARNLLAESARVLELALKAQPDRWDLRKELAEIYTALQDAAKARSLFDGPAPASLSTEVRQEVALYFISRKWWPQAQRLLEAGLTKSSGSFESRLLLARVVALMGDQAAAEQHLSRCREQCDTPARYAAWLAQAWERAMELAGTDSLLQIERDKLQPPAGGKWDENSLAKLVILAQTAAQSALHEQAEKELRAMLANTALPDATRAELQQLLISVLQLQPGGGKALEQELQAALANGNTRQVAEMRLRLLLLYHQSQRLDLVQPLLRQIDPSQYEDAALLRQALAIVRHYDETEVAIALAERLVRLQPDEHDHWAIWTSLLHQTGDEARLRSSLHELRSRGRELGLSSDVLEILRTHLAASAWRSLSSLLADPESSVDDARHRLDELDALETDPTRRLWGVWVRGLFAVRTGDEKARAAALRALDSAADWVPFPDGLSLSLSEARRLLAKPEITPPSQPLASASYATAPALNWVFEAKGQADLQRWCLTPDGRLMLAQDSAARLYAVDRESGRLLWDQRLNLEGTKAAAMTPASGGEQVTYPAEWCVSDQNICCLNEAALTCRRLLDGALLWQIPLRHAVPGTQGSLAVVSGRVLWWRAAMGRLDALDESTGKLLWTTAIPALAREPESTVNQPVWLSSGISVDAGRVLVWGQGSALVRVDDGALLAKAAVGTQDISFPLDLKSLRASSASSSPVLSANRAQTVNALALPSYGYPGMYGSMVSSPWLLWGGDGARLLHGDGIWLLGQNMPAAQYSVLGIPRLRSSALSRNQLSSALPIGVVGRSLIVAQETGVLKMTPEGSVRRLAATGFRDNSPSKHALPAVALDGSQVGIATQEGLCLIDALTGQVVWQVAWPQDAEPILQKARDSLSLWQSLRWSSRGLMLHDGTGRSLVIEWQALMSHGDFIVPVGTQSLICLRCQ